MYAYSYNHTLVIGIQMNEFKLCTNTALSPALLCMYMLHVCMRIIIIIWLRCKHEGCVAYEIP